MHPVLFAPRFHFLYKDFSSYLQSGLICSFQIIGPENCRAPLKIRDFGFWVGKNDRATGVYMPIHE
ncbi:MAG: hypothetical protein ACRD22_14835, partial [Terriglobia bacterium]